MLSRVNSKFATSLMADSSAWRRFQSNSFMERLVEEHVEVRWVGRLRGVKEEKAAAVATRADRTTRRTMVANSSIGSMVVDLVDLVLFRRWRSSGLNIMMCVVRH